jgi:hypothetical protein
MFLSREELIEEIEYHIRKSGGGFGEWFIGTAKDCRGPFSPIQGIGARSSAIWWPIWATG